MDSSSGGHSDEWQPEVGRCLPHRPQDEEQGNEPCSHRPCRSWTCHSRGFSRASAGLRLLLAFMTCQVLLVSSALNSNPPNINIGERSASPDFRCLGFNPPGATETPHSGRWRSWRLNVTSDKGEIFRLRRCLTEAEEDLARLSEDLIDAKQAQERANVALKTKDQKLTLALQELDRATRQPDASEHRVDTEELRDRITRLEQANMLLRKENEDIHAQAGEVKMRESKLEDEIQARATIMVADMMEDTRSHWEAERVIELAQERKEHEEAVAKIKSEMNKVEKELAQATRQKEAKEATIGQLEQQLTIFKIQLTQNQLNRTKLLPGGNENKDLKRQVTELQEQLAAVQSRTAFQSASVGRLAKRKQELEVENQELELELLELRNREERLMFESTQNITEIRERHAREIQEIERKLREEQQASAPQTPRAMSSSNILGPGERVISDTSTEDSPLLPVTHPSLRTVSTPPLRGRTDAERIRLYEKPVEYEMLRAEGMRHLAAMNDDIHRLRSELNQLISEHTCMRLEMQQIRGVSPPRTGAGSPSYSSPFQSPPRTTQHQYSPTGQPQRVSMNYQHRTAYLANQQRSISRDESEARSRSESRPRSWASWVGSCLGFRF